MAKYLITVVIILTLFLAGCETNNKETIPKQEISEEAPTGPTPRNNILTTPEPVTIDEEQPLAEDWTTKNGATFLVSDGEQAARFYLPEGETVELPLRTPTTITVLAVDEEQAYLEINKEKTFIQLREDYTTQQNIIISVREIIIK